MTPNREDTPLHALFAALRAQEAAAARTFEHTLADARAQTRRQSRSMPLRPAVAIIAVVLLALVVRAVPVRPPDARPRSSAAPIDLTSHLWRAPTDFLLDLPGAELLRTIPTLGQPYPGLTPPSHPGSPDSIAARKGGPKS